MAAGGSGIDVREEGASDGKGSGDCEGSGNGESSASIGASIGVM
jgi:hypothetical protein